MRPLYNPARELLSYVGPIISGIIPIISGALTIKIEANTDILTLRLIRDHRSALNLSRFGLSVITGLRRILSIQDRWTNNLCTPSHYSQVTLIQSTFKPGSPCIPRSELPVACWQPSESSSGGHFLSIGHACLAGQAVPKSHSSSLSFNWACVYR